MSAERKQETIDKGVNFYKCKHCDSVDINTDNKFKDAIELNGNYYTVYLAVCSNCGRVYDNETWIE